jgi:hypothetical protein
MLNIPAIGLSVRVLALATRRRCYGSERQSHDGAQAFATGSAKHDKGESILLCKVMQSPAELLVSTMVDTGQRLSREVGKMSVRCKALAATVSQSRVCDRW